MPARCGDFRGRDDSDGRGARPPPDLPRFDLQRIESLVVAPSPLARALFGPPPSLESLARDPSGARGALRACLVPGPTFNAFMIEIQNLTKRFGALTAVDDVSFSVARGEVLGFLGPNGAGKSTTMKMVTGFLDPTSGSDARCGGDDVLPTTPMAAQAQDRVPARGRAPVRRHDAPRPSCKPSPPKPRVRPAPTCARRGRRGHRARAASARGAAPAHRDAVQGLQAPGRAGPGHPARPRRVDPRRAHRRSRSEPEARRARADPRRCPRTRSSCCRPTSSRKSLPSARER